MNAINIYRLEFRRPSAEISVSDERSEERP
jgi:hypothetical protein